MQKQFKPKVNLPSYVKVSAMLGNIPGYKKIMAKAIYEFDQKRNENLRKVNRDSSKDD
jgi:hypothetical protein